MSQDFFQRRNEIPISILIKEVPLEKSMTMSPVKHLNERSSTSLSLPSKSITSVVSRQSSSPTRSMLTSFTSNATTKKNETRGPTYYYINCLESIKNSLSIISKTFLVFISLILIYIIIIAILSI